MTDEQLVELITRHGIANAQACVDAAHEGYRPTLPRCLALLENESMGRNIYQEGPPLEGREPTEENYRDVYARDGLAGRVGIGPCQLTSAGLIDSANALGGVWVPLHNMQTGFAFLHGLILGHGVWEGFRRYNGAGPAAVAYADRASARAGAWEERLRAAGA